MTRYIYSCKCLFLLVSQRYGFVLIAENSAAISRFRIKMCCFCAKSSVNVLALLTKSVMKESPSPSGGHRVRVKRYKICFFGSPTKIQQNLRTFPYVTWELRLSVKERNAPQSQKMSVPNFTVSNLHTLVPLAPQSPFRFQKQNYNGRSGGFYVQVDPAESNKKHEVKIFQFRWISN